MESPFLFKTIMSNPTNPAYDATYNSRWIIHDFREKFNTHELISSTCKFMTVPHTIENLKFQWHVYPKGISKSGEWVSVYITFSKFINTDVVCLSILIRLMDDKYNLIVEKSLLKHRPAEYENKWGFANFFKTNLLLDDANITSKGLILEYQIKLDEKIPLIRNSKNIEELTKPSNVNSDYIYRLEEFDKFESLIDEQQYSDVSFIIENKTVQAHKCILAKRSTVFAAMFQHRMTETLTNKVEIEDIKYDTFMEMLRFVYTGKVNGLENSAEEILVAAHKYSIDGLIIECERMLGKNLSVDNAIKNLQLANLYNLNILKEDAIKFCVLHKTEIYAQPEFKLLMDMPEITFKLCEAMMKSPM